MIEFSIVDWAAWAPGLSERSQWLGWADAPYPPQGEDTPALAEIPAMQRRRIERLGRMAIQAACWCEDGQGADSQVPLVFASRHGDVARSMDLLGALASDQPLSPTGFGLSVHNAIAALYSIARGQRQLPGAGRRPGHGRDRLPGGRRAAGRWCPRSAGGGL